MIGTDIVYLPRISPDSPFCDYVLSSEEKKEFESRQNERRKTEYLGGRFAAKEAIFKATGDRNYLKYSILNDEYGKPYVLNHPEISVSISHEQDYAVAFVMVKEK